MVCFPIQHGANGCSMSPLGCSIPSLHSPTAPRLRPPSLPHPRLCTAAFSNHIWCLRSFKSYPHYCESNNALSASVFLQSATSTIVRRPPPPLVGAVAVRSSAASTTADSSPYLVLSRQRSKERSCQAQQLFWRYRILPRLSVPHHRRGSVIYGYESLVGHWHLQPLLNHASKSHGLSGCQRYHTVDTSSDGIVAISINASALEIRRYVSPAISPWFQPSSRHSLLTSYANIPNQTRGSRSHLSHHPPPFPRPAIMKSSPPASPSRIVTDNDDLSKSTLVDVQCLASLVPIGRTAPTEAVKMNTTRARVKVTESSAVPMRTCNLPKTTMTMTTPHSE